MKMKTLKLLPYFVIAGLIVLLFLQRECKRCPEVTTVTETKDSIYFISDTIVFYKTKYLPKPYAVIDTLWKHDTIFRTHDDTVKAIRDYTAYKKYDLQVLNDSTGKINCLVDLQYNNIAKYSIKGTVYDRTKVIEHNHYVMEEKRLKVFAGVNLGYSIPDTSLLIKPTLQLLTKKDHVYQVGYEPFRQIVEVGLLWKIRLKK